MLRILATAAALLLAACAHEGAKAPGQEGAAAPAEAKAIQSAAAPKAIGPYSQAIEVPGGRLLFVSGQLPLDPATGEFVAGDIAAHTDRVMQNLKSVLEAGGASFDRVVKTTIYLVDLADFKAVNEAYGRNFGQAPPARATVQVRALPRGARVEIELVAAR